MANSPENEAIFCYHLVVPNLYDFLSGLPKALNGHGQITLCLLIKLYTIGRFKASSFIVLSMKKQRQCLFRLELYRQFLL